MADHAKATEHHGKAGAALKAGDFKKAAHHMGHALAACRQHGHEPPKGGGYTPAGMALTTTTAGVGGETDSAAPKGKIAGNFAKLRGSRS